MDSSSGIETASLEMMTLRFPRRSSLDSTVKRQKTELSQPSDTAQCTKPPKRHKRTKKSDRVESADLNDLAGSDEPTSIGKLKVKKKGRAEPLKKFKQTTLYGEIAVTEGSDDDGSFNSDDLTDDDGVRSAGSDEDDDCDAKEIIPTKDRKSAPTRHQIMASRRVIWFRQNTFRGASSASSQESRTNDLDSSVELIEAESSTSDSARGSQSSITDERRHLSAELITPTSLCTRTKRKYRRNYSIKKYLVMKTESTIEDSRNDSTVSQSTANTTIIVSDSDDDVDEGSSSQNPTDMECSKPIVLDSSTDNIEDINDADCEQD
ncbi:uncharacterized protein LOC129587809 [Paramacrobiotus metropolitanus]|uniref:uncharacterized protein LOC129587809 n=1 Tax=Paramacrobiotus metropolitanus TaxID=2943436 RepID=UPI002445A23D|nr:uncharacterized protein LOC129587809 [Paramacrobiotus metropolitanus]XP_055337707.1 uncharacterized protein LOC129587809 [Paramacrobiotus metropolitanus]XP_055337708.1 uncharacterized protein LOC129587809 [Paramacrobiotus metropolitanus]